MQLSKQAQNEIKNYDFNDTKFIIGDEWLYQITKKYPSNLNEDIIASKLLIIGRTYAAALERVHEKNKKIDYYDVAKEIVKSNIEQDIQNLKTIKRIDENTILSVALLHYKLTKIFEKYTKIDKRSLASKYLHFHLPNIVFIYDSRVVTVIGDFIDGKCYLSNYEDIKEKINKKAIDKEYVFYCLKAYEIYKKLEKNNNFRNGKESLPRYVDRLLLRYCDKKGI